MTWDSIGDTQKTQENAKQKAAERQQAELELCKKFYRVFNTDEGKAVFEHLFQRFIMSNSTQLNAPNPNYEAAYHNGESGVIHYITSKMSKATQ